MMPQPRIYANRAQQQAAYRRRRANAQLAHSRAKGLPALPAIPAMPGTTRWRAAARMAHDLLTTICDEMQTYADDRTVSLGATLPFLDNYGSSCNETHLRWNECECGVLCSKAAGSRNRPL